MFFHYHLNLFICCKAKLKIKLIFYKMSLFYRMNFLQSEIFFSRIKFFERGNNIYFKYFYLKNKILLRKIKFLEKS